MLEAACSACLHRRRVRQRQGLARHLATLRLPPRPTQQVLKLSDGTVLQIEQFNLPPKVSALPHLFSSASVEVHCSGHAVRAGRQGPPSAGSGLAVQEAQNCMARMPVPRRIVLCARQVLGTSASAGFKGQAGEHSLPSSQQHQQTLHHATAPASPPPAWPPYLQHDLHVFAGPSMAAVRRAYDRGERAWCGLRHRLRESPNCTVSIPPHGTTLVAVAKPRAWLTGGCHFWLGGRRVCLLGSPPCQQGRRRTCPAGRAAGRGVLLALPCLGPAAAAGMHL